MLCDKTDPFGFHQRKQGVHQDKILCFNEFMCLFGYFLKLLIDSHPGNVAFTVIGMLHINKRCHSYHEKLIKIRSRYRQKFESVHKRIGRIRCLTEYPFIEHQP